MSSVLTYALAALAEVVACFSFWAWSRLGRSWRWLIVGCVALALFGLLLTSVGGHMVAHAVAGYFGVYLSAGLLWTWIVDGLRPSDWSVGEGAVCVTAIGMCLLALP